MMFNLRLDWSTVSSAGQKLGIYKRHTNLVRPHASRRRHCQYRSGSALCWRTAVTSACRVVADTGVRWGWRSYLPTGTSGSWSISWNQETSCRCRPNPCPSAVFSHFTRSSATVLTATSRENSSCASLSSVTACIKLSPNADQNTMNIIMITINFWQFTLYSKNQTERKEQINEKSWRDFILPNNLMSLNALTAFIVFCPCLLVVFFICFTPRLKDHLLALPKLILCLKWKLGKMWIFKSKDSKSARIHMRVAGLYTC